MEVDDDVSCTSTVHYSDKSLSSTATTMVKASTMEKGKKKVNEEFSRCQDLREMKDCLHTVL